jgi:hypothetical protein
MENNNETVNQEKATSEAQERTFTQSELDAIIGDRLARVKEKYADYELLKGKANKLDEIEEASKTELQKATERAEALETELSQLKQANEIKEMREKVAKETGVPVNLITGSTEEECTEQANGIKAFAVPNGYPSIRDAGEPQTMSKGSVRDDFAAWANAVNS